MLRSTLLVVLCGVVVAGCGGSSSTSPSDPSAPAIGNIQTSGNWTGTLTRPNGVTIAVAWTPTQTQTGDAKSGQSAGPATFTVGNIVMKGTITLGIGGSVGSPIYSINLTVDAGTAGSTLPNCKFNGQANGQVGNGTPPQLTNGGKRIDAALSNMSYTACPEMVSGVFVQESDQLSVVQQ